MKKLLLTLSLFSAVFFVMAQDGDNQERIQALKIAFITKRLDLSSEEAQRFWPVYNRYENDIKQVMAENRNGGDVLENDERILNVKKRYRSEFIRILGQPKANNLFNAEHEFRGVLMRNLKNRQGFQRPMKLRKLR